MSAVSSTRDGGPGRGRTVGPGRAPALPVSPGGRAASALFRAGIAAGLVFLLAPLLVVVAWSFNAGVNGRQTAAFTGATAAAYAVAASDSALTDAVVTSVGVALAVATLSVPLGSALAWSAVRHPSRAVRRALSATVIALLVVPETVLGVTLLLGYTLSGIPLGVVPLILAHTPPAIAVVALIVRARLETLDPGLEDAAADLGATPAVALRTVVLPQLAPAVVAAALLAYVFSVDDVVISSFLATAQVTTLPVYLYGTLQYGPTPAAYAAVTVLFGATLAAIGVAVVLVRGGRRLGVRADGRASGRP